MYGGVYATGAEYRGLPVENLASFNGGAGVYHVTTPMEAQMCRGEDVIIVGGGNSASQAAVYPADNARRVIMLVRSGGLPETISDFWQPDSGHPGCPRGPPIRAHRRRCRVSSRLPEP